MSVWKSFYWKPLGRSHGQSNPWKSGAMQRGSPCVSRGLEDLPFEMANLIWTILSEVTLVCRKVSPNESKTLVGGQCRLHFLNNRENPQESVWDQRRVSSFFLSFTSFFFLLCFRISSFTWGCSL